MHIFKMESRREVVYSVAISIIRESLGIDQCIYLGFRCKSLALNVWLGQDDTEEPICISGKANDAHDGLSVPSLGRIWIEAILLPPESIHPWLLPIAEVVALVPRLSASLLAEFRFLKHRYLR